MVLYHAVTYFQVLWIIIYHLKYHKEEKGVLILVESLESRFTETIRKNLQEIFEVYYFPYGKIGKVPITNDTKEKNEFIAEKMETLYEKYIGYDLRQFHKIYIAGYHFYFTLLLIKEKLEFNVIEEAVGMLSRPEVLCSIVESLNPIQLEIGEYSGLLYADNQYIKNKYCSLKHQKPGFYDEKVIDIDIMQIMREFDRNTRKRVIEVFIERYQEVKIPKNSMLLLTQHFANLKILTFEEHALIYQLYVDYFVEEKPLIIKTHPDDIMYYSKLFPNAQIIKEKFPSELLPYIFNVIPKTIGTISSTAIFSIRENFENSIEFTPKFEKEFRKIHKYYMVVSILKVLDYEQEIQIVGCNLELMRNLAANADLKMEFAKWKVIEEDKMSEIDWEKPVCVDQYTGNYFTSHNEKIKEYAENIIFMNPQGIEAMRECVPIVIEKEYLQNENVFADEQQEVIFFYSCNGEKKKMVNKFERKKVLKNTGIVINKYELTEGEMKVKVLEGILNATEERLAYYIQLEKDLCQKIEELESGSVLRGHIEQEKQLENEVEKLKQENDNLKNEIEKILIKREGEENDENSSICSD